MKIPIRFNKEGIRMLEELQFIYKTKNRGQTCNEILRNHKEASSIDFIESRMKFSEKKIIRTSVLLNDSSINYLNDIMKQYDIPSRNLAMYFIVKQVYDSEMSRINKLSEYKK